MKLLNFLADLQSTRQLPSARVICFVGSNTLSLLFFSYLMRFLMLNGCTSKTIDASEMDVAVFKTYAETMSFSGAVIYYVTNVHELPVKKRQEWQAYVQIYAGPHTIIFFSNDHNSNTQQSANTVYVELDELIAARDFASLRFLVHNESINEKGSCASFLMAENSTLSLDMSLLFVCYESVLGKSVNEFFKEWVPHLVEPTQSLFLLSQYFFSKNSKKFYPLWAHGEEQYGPPFWIAFWSDQLWRAYLYCDLMQKKEYAEAKKAGYKLPFSLLNRDWASLRLDELKNALAYLSDLDFKLKNGGSMIGFELFFDTFFYKKES